MKKRATATPAPAQKRAADESIFKLRLYVAGQTPKSLTALTNWRKICSEYLTESYEIEVIDLLKNPTLAAGDQIIASRTLVRSLPEPLRKIIGALSDTER